MVRDHNVSIFDHERQPLRDCVSKVFAAASFLQYEAVEEVLVGRIVMKPHPTGLAHAAFLDRPRYRKDLINAVGLIERFSVVRERKRTQTNFAISSWSSARSLEESRNVPRDLKPSRCWNCGRAGHVSRDCRRQPPVWKRAGARRSVGPRAATVGAIREVVVTLSATLFWIELSLRTGKVPALDDTGAQLSCLRSDLVEYLYMRGEGCTFSHYVFPGLLADGTKSQVNDAVKLHVRLHSFSWDHEFKILKEGPFSAIVGMDFLQRTRMRIDVSSRNYGFAFAPNVVGSCLNAESLENNEEFLQRLCGEVVGCNAREQNHPSDLRPEILKEEFPSLFSSSLGISKCNPYHIELADTTLDPSPPLRCAPPNGGFKNI